MNFYDVLAAEKWGGGISTMNFFDLLFAQSVGGGKNWQVYEGTLPATINANGSDLRQYQVWGNTGGVGDKTAQLFDKISAYEAGYYTSNGTFVYSAGVITYDYFPVEALTEYFYKAFNATPSSAESERTIHVNFFDSQKSFISRFLDIGTALSTKNVTTPQNCAFARLSVNKILSNIVFGTVPFETFVPFGHEVDIGVKSGNVMPSALAETKTLNGVTITCDGEGRYSISGETDQNTDIVFDIPSFTVPVSIYNGGDGFLMLHNTAFSNVNLDFLYNGTIKEAWSLAMANRTSTNFSRLSGIPINAIRFHVTSGTVNGIVCPMFTNNGESTPVKYQPYSSTTTPIYIGDEPLEKDEYVDYQAGKVYRMIDGVLTPTDPPVPLPALPTCEGTTIVDYAGSGTAPEKVYFEYQGGKQP